MILRKRRKFVARAFWKDMLYRDIANAVLYGNAIRFTNFCQQSQEVYRGSSDYVYQGMIERVFTINE